MVEGLHHDKLQLIAQKLFDGRLVLLFNFRVIRQHAHRPKLLPAAPLIRRKKFLHGFRRVRPVIQNLCQRRVARPHSRQRVTHRVHFFRQPIALLTQRADLRLQLRRAVLQRAELP